MQFIEPFSRPFPDVAFPALLGSKERQSDQGILAFDNNSEGFKDALNWALLIAAQYGKTQIVLGLEPTGHYWFTGHLPSVRYRFFGKRRELRRPEMGFPELSVFCRTCILC